MMIGDRLRALREERKMRQFVTLFSLLLIGTGSLSAGKEIPAITLLQGYHAKRVPSVDTSSWTIEREGGLIIHFEAGPSEGLAVDSKHMDQYKWYRVQTINGHRVLVALVKPGLKTDPDLDVERNLPPGNILLVSFPLSGGSRNAANFVGKIANTDEMADMLLMALSFDPSKQF
jgi:hypothetical protein